jgi:hypothetical protein
MSGKQDPETDPNLWRTLKLGDRVRLVHIREFLQPGYVILPETMRVYSKLLARRGSLRVAWIDEYDQPWVVVRFRRKNGRYETHWLSVNHDGLVRVRSRG